MDDVRWRNALSNPENSVVVACLFTTYGCRGDLQRSSESE